MTAVRSVLSTVQYLLEFCGKLRQYFVMESLAVSVESLQQVGY
jgi:hypothetical protein